MTGADASGAATAGGGVHTTAAGPGPTADADQTASPTTTGGPTTTAGIVEVTAERVRAELDQIVDPCSAVAGAPAGLVEMGLLRELALHAGRGGVDVRVRLGVTEPGCLMGGSFAVQARERLERLDGVASVDIELDHDADWSPSDLAPSYQLRLEAVRAERRHALDERRARSGGPEPRRPVLPQGT